MTEIPRRALVIGGLLVAVSSTLIACGGSDTKRAGVADASPDAASGGQPNGSGGAAGMNTGGTVAANGGTATGGTATGGTATGGTATGGTATGGARGTDAGRDASLDASHPEPSLDAAREASTAACTDAGDGGGQWRDFGEGVCRACPASVPTCDDLVRAGVSFDRATHVLVLQLAPDIAELRTAALAFFYYAQTDAGSEYTQIGPVTGVVNQNTLTFDLSGISPPVNQLTGGGLTLVDACGVTTQTDLDYRALEVDVVTTDSGTDQATIFCYDDV